jgi:hypothetical protein
VGASAEGVREAEGVKQCAALDRLTVQLLNAEVGSRGGGRGGSKEAGTEVGVQASSVQRLPC